MGESGTRSPAADSTQAATDTQDARRVQILRAALEVILERGYPETRIADVADRVDVSPALIVYYFKTKDRLLAEASRYAEDVWYEDSNRRMASIRSATARLEELIRMTCVAETGVHDSDVSWSLWLDLWAQALRHPDVRQLREEFDENWRATIRQIVADGMESGEFATLDANDFAVTLSALLDGFAVQIALQDPVVTVERCTNLALDFAAKQLGLGAGGLGTASSPGPASSADGGPGRRRAGAGAS